MTGHQQLAHALRPGPIDDLRTKCGKRLTRRSKGTLAMNPAAATCVACKAVVDAEQELERYKRGPVRPDLEKYYEWAMGPDSGISSKTIVQLLTNASVLGSWTQATPRDPADFGRCYRMLKKFPELRPRLAEVAERAPDWARLVGAWSELEALWDSESPSGECPKLYARMQELSHD